MRAIYCCILYRVKTQTELSPRYTNFITASQFLYSFVSSWSDPYSRWSGSRIKVFWILCAWRDFARSFARSCEILCLVKEVSIFTKEENVPPLKASIKTDFFLFFFLFSQRQAPVVPTRCITLLIFFPDCHDGYSASTRVLRRSRFLIIAPLFFPPPFRFSINLKILVNFS